MNLETERFDFKAPDGTKLFITIHQARALGCPDMRKRADEIVDYYKNRNKLVRIRDGFVAGWQENIQAYAGSRKEYDRMLRERGLIEVGNEKLAQAKEVDYNPFSNEELIKHAIQSGIELSGREIEALKSGEYFKDFKAVFG